TCPHPPQTQLPPRRRQTLQLQSPLEVSQQPQFLFRLCPHETNHQQLQLSLHTSWAFSGASYRRSSVSPIRSLWVIQSPQLQSPLKFFWTCQLQGLLEVGQTS
ncbi:hypothetical protein XENOCAPTIV_002671, partial [Xenoophorus captivus]